jgi:hypothetical protein
MAAEKKRCTEGSKRPMSSALIRRMSELSAYDQRLHASIPRMTALGFKMAELDEFPTEEMCEEVISAFQDLQIFESDRVNYVDGMGIIHFLLQTACAAFRYKLFMQ